MKTRCPHCGGELVVTTIVRDPLAGSNARWSEATDEDKQEQARKMNEGRKRKPVGIVPAALPAEKLQEAIATKIPARTPRASDMCPHGKEHGRCSMMTCKQA